MLPKPKPKKAADDSNAPKLDPASPTFIEDLIRYRRQLAAIIPGLPTLREDQAEIVMHPARRKVVVMGRRWGKSTMAAYYALLVAFAGGRVAWIVPTYKNSLAPWRFLEKLLQPLIKHKRVRLSKQERTIEFRDSGGSITVFSGDNENSIRGESFHLVIIDEAAMVKESAYRDAIEPTLADFGGICILISTPKGRNWFFKEYQEAAKDVKGYAAKWNAPTVANPHPNIQKAYFEAKERYGETHPTFRQEWDAQFLENGGEVFRQITQSANPPAVRPDHVDCLYFGGSDWGQQKDFTVTIVLELNLVTSKLRLVKIDRYNQVSWKLQRERVELVYNEWGIQRGLVEVNSIGGPNYEELERAGLEVEAWYMLASNKPDLIDDLALAIEQNEIELPATLNHLKILIAELELYQRKRTDTGRSKYSAPSGEHDDTVVALALAYRAASSYFAGGLTLLPSTFNAKIENRGDW